MSSRYYTGDNTYNDITKQAMLFQVGPNNNYEPENQTRTEVREHAIFERKEG
jgi:mannan endo-1,6-alpha-mannosidase